MIPDYVLFAETYLSIITFKLYFVEVKRKENHYKGNYESDFVKLGNAMQIGINNKLLILQKVANLKVVGLPIKKGEYICNSSYYIITNIYYRSCCNSF
jgi:hypothetical protein